MGRRPGNRGSWTSLLVFWCWRIGRGFPSGAGSRWRGISFTVHPAVPPPAEEPVAGVRTTPAALVPGADDLLRRVPRKGRGIGWFLQVMQAHRFSP